MKKIILLLVALIMLSACAVQAGDSTPTELPSSTLPVADFTPAPTGSSVPEIETPSPSVQYGMPPSYEEVRRDIDAYFRMYYATNQNYTWKHVEVEQRRADCTGVAGYFDGDSLVKMESRYGDTNHSIYTYYFVNEYLTYVISETHWSMSKQKKYNDYFIVDEILWQYDNEAVALIESHDTDVINEYKQLKCELLNGAPMSFVNNGFVFPSGRNMFVQFSESKKAYFEKLITGNMHDEEIFQVDLPNYSELSYGSALFDGVDLLKMSVWPFDENSYTNYEFCLIDHTHIYVVVHYQEYESYEVKINDYTKNCLCEYFIVDGKVMVYDPKVGDLVESPENAFIFELYQKIYEEAIKIVD